MRSRALSLAALAFLAGFLSVVDARIVNAQNLDANKSPAQIFSSTCSACHRSARGLVKSIPPGSLPGFLRQHYTTSNAMASGMAAYVLASGGTDRVAGPAKREPKQKAVQQSETPEAAADRLQAQQERRERAKAAREKAANKKGKTEPAETAKPAEDTVKPAAPVETAKPDVPASSPADTPAVAPPAEAAEPAEPVPATPPPAAPSPAAAEVPAAAPPARPAGIILPGFPLPEGVTEPTAPAASSPNPPVTAAPETPAEPKPAGNDTTRAKPEATPESAPPKESPNTDIMQEEVHTPKPGSAAQRKKKSD